MRKIVIKNYFLINRKVFGEENRNWKKDKDMDKEGEG